MPPPATGRSAVAVAVPRPAARPELRRVALLLFAGIFLVQFAFSPLDLRGMGYSDEEVAATFRLLSWMTAAPAPAGAAPLLSPQGILTRHGVLEPLAKLPFAAAGRALAPLFPDSPRFAERFVALLPLLETALIATLLFLWTTRLTASLRWGLALALGGAFCTLLWPYAYIGLELTQALALFLAGFLALGRDDTSAMAGRGRTLGFVAAAAVAVAAKGTGLLLFPAVAYLAYRYFHRRATRRAPGATGVSRRPLSATVASLVVVLAVVFGNKFLRSYYLPPWVEADFLRQFLEKNPAQVAAHMLLLLFSGNKGLVVYSPIALLGLAALPAAWRKNREVAIFVLLTTGSLLAGFAVVGMPAEETWGPRYLYSAVAPLVVGLAAAWGREPLAGYRRLLLAGALVAGLGVSALGSLFYYGRLLQVAQQADQATLEALWGDPVWNPVVMDMRLAKLWLAPAGTPTVWTPRHHWWYTRPPGVPADKGVDLAFACEPQPLLLRRGTRERPGFFGALAASLVLGLAALGAAGREVRRDFGGGGRR